MSEDAADRASDQYDRAEKAYLSALASGSDDEQLWSLAKDVTDAAKAWESADYAAAQPPSGITKYYDPPEILATLWRDIADAYGLRARP